MTTKKTIYIIRHGETDFNRKGVIQGGGVNSDLNNKGRHQATLFHMAYGHIPFEHIYISSLIRTLQSVSPFIQSGISYEALAELDEINWGVFEGVKVNPTFKTKYRYIVSRWRMGHLNEPIEGGESPLTMYSRQQQGLNKILENSSNSPILICMHGRAMRSFLSLLLQTPLKNMDDYPHSNLCLYVVEMLGDVGELKVFNDTQHLQ